MHIVGSVRQIHIGISRFPVDSEYEFMESTYSVNIKIKEIHSVKPELILENFSWIYGICYKLCALPFKINIHISFLAWNLAQNLHRSVEEPDQISKCHQDTSCTVQCA